MIKLFFTKKNIIALAGLTLWVLPTIANAAASLGIEWGTGTGLGTRNLKDTISTILNVLLGFLGILAVIIILLGGFKWMTAMGEEEKVGEAKKLISAGIVGLVVILAAYAIAKYVIETISTATQ